MSRFVGIVLSNERVTGISGGQSYKWIQMEYYYTGSQLLCIFYEANMGIRWINANEAIFLVNLWRANQIILVIVILL